MAIRKNKKSDQLDFEIKFYEKLIKEKPDFVDALIPLGDAYTKKGYYEKGLKVDLKLVKLKSDDPIAWYNLACSLSLLKRSTESLSAIGKSLRLGYRDIKYLLSDPDLENLRKSEKFKEIVFRLTGQQN